MVCNQNISFQMRLQGISTESNLKNFHCAKEVFYWAHVHWEIKRRETSMRHPALHPLHVAVWTTNDTLVRGQCDAVVMGWRENWRASWPLCEMERTPLMMGWMSWDSLTAGWTTRSINLTTHSVWVECSFSLVSLFLSECVQMPIWAIFLRNQLVDRKRKLATMPSGYKMVTIREEQTGKPCAKFRSTNLFLGCWHNHQPGPVPTLNHQILQAMNGC